MRRGKGKVGEEDPDSVRGGEEERRRGGEEERQSGGIEGAGGSRRGDGKP